MNKRVPIGARAWSALRLVPTAVAPHPVCLRRIALPPASRASERDRERRRVPPTRAIASARGCCATPASLPEQERESESFDEGHTHTDTRRHTYTLSLGRVIDPAAARSLTTPPPMAPPEHGFCFGFCHHPPANGTSLSLFGVCIYTGLWGITRNVFVATFFGKYFGAFFFF